jgi:imidazolonepropionase-like amidohydrolase
MKRIIFLILLIISVGRISGQVIALVGGHIIHPETRKITYESLILITGDRITHIGNKYTSRIPPNARIINVSGKWLIPGLIEAHAHFFQSGGLYTRPDIITWDSLRESLSYYKTYAQDRQWLKENRENIWRRYLANGVTTVVDMGGPITQLSMRSQALQTPTAPTLLMAGPLISTYQPQGFPGPDLPIIKAHSESQARQLVLEQLPYKPDLIKIWYIASKGESAESNFPIVKAAITEAHRHNLPVAVHATELQTAKLAVEAGADILVHSIEDSLIPEDFLQTLQKKKIGYIPTLIVGKRYREVFSRRFRFTKEEILWGDPEIVASLLEIKKLEPNLLPEKLKKRLPLRDTIAENPIALANLKAVKEKNIRIALGTDAGNIGTLHGASYTHEAMAMRKAGLAPWEILKAATYDAARIFKKENEIGSIQKGKRADIVILNQNPLDSIGNLSDIFMAIKYGIPFFRDSLLRFSNTDIVNIQLNAYNANHIEAFMHTYSPDIKIYIFPDNLRFSSFQSMKLHYQKFFEENPNLYCAIQKRIEQNQYIIDQEKVTGLSNSQILRASAIYQVENGKIQKVWFVR